MVNLIVYFKGDTIKKMIHSPFVAAECSRSVHR